MKPWSLIIASTLLIACRSDRKPNDQPHALAVDSAAEVFDLSLCVERAMNAEEFLKRCQAATWLIFTYDVDVAQALSTRPANFDGPAQLAAAELERYLAT